MLIGSSNLDWEKRRAWKHHEHVGGRPSPKQLGICITFFFSFFIFNCTIVPTLEALVFQ